MHHFKNFTQYTPTDPKYTDLLAMGVGFCRDEQGRDWYELRDGFQKDTFKVVYSGTTIIGTSQDAMELNPLNASVIELESLPEDYDNLQAHFWRIVDGVMERDVETYRAAIESRLQTAASELALLSTDANLGIPVDEEYLAQLRAYYRALRALDPNLCERMVFPERPTKEE